MYLCISSFPHRFEGLRVDSVASAQNVKPSDAGYHCKHDLYKSNLMDEGKKKKKKMPTCKNISYTPSYPLPPPFRR